jgi:hypothetical protein
MLQAESRAVMLRDADQVAHCGACSPEPDLGHSSCQELGPQCSGIKLRGTAAYTLLDSMSNVEDVICE